MRIFMKSIGHFALGSMLVVLGAVGFVWFLYGFFWVCELTGFGPPATNVSFWDAVGRGLENIVLITLVLCVLFLFAESKRIGQFVLSKLR